jgi:alpha-glycerophosphate oxidase/glycerol-3-phosphate dehydrogenase
MELDALTPKHAPEPLSLRYWRRYGTDAFELLTAIAQDPTESEQVLQCADYTRAELRLTARREMIVDIHDFLRRRSKIAQVVRLRALLEDPGLPELVSLLMAASAPAAIAQLRESAELSA